MPAGSELIIRITRYANWWMTYHIKCLKQFAQLVGMLIFIIYSIEHYVLDKDFLLTASNKLPSDISKNSCWET